MLSSAVIATFVLLQGLSWDPYADGDADTIRVYYDPGGLAYWTPIVDFSPAIGIHAVDVEFTVDTSASCTVLPIAFMVRAVNTEQSPEAVSSNSNVAHATWILASGSTLRDFASCAGVDICPACVGPGETCPDGCACGPCA